MADMELCVVTLNCWGIRVISKDRVARMEAIAAELGTGKYDFVFLQEVWTSEDYERIRARTRDVLPHSHYFYSGVIGAGICIFSKSVIKRAFFHQWAVNGYMHKLQHGDWFGGKGIGMVEVVHRGLKINLYTTHLHAEYDRLNDEYLAHRVIQAFDTAQFVRMTSKGADVVILGGDLNTEPGDIAYKVIIHTAKLTDAVLDLDEPGPTEKLNTNDIPQNSYTSPYLLKENPNGKRIDYICFKTKGPYAVKTLSCVTPWPSRVPGQPFSYSDHEAVVAKLQIRSAQLAKPRRAACEEKLAVLSSGVNICSQALESLKMSKMVYTTISMVCLVLMIQGGPSWMVVPEMLSFLNPVIRLLFLLFFIFTGIMGTVWNRMEVNGILAGKLTMELECDYEECEMAYAGGDSLEEE